MSDKNLAIKIHFEAMDKLTGSLKNIFDAAGGAKTKIKDLSGTIRDQKGELKKLENEYDELKKSIKGLTGMDHLLDPIVAKMSQLRGKTESANEALRAQRKILEHNRKLKEAGGNAMGYGATATGAGVATLIPIVNSTKAAIEFESAMGGVRKILDMPSPEMERLQKYVLDLSTKTPLAADGIASIVEAAAANGVGSAAFAAGNYEQGRKELIDFAETAAQMATAFDISAKEAGDSMAAWRASMNLSQDEVKSLADLMNKIADTDKGGSAKGINNIVTRIGALAEVAGISGTQLTAMAALLDAQKVPADVAATSIKNMALALTKGENATKGQKAAWGKLGLDHVQVAKNMQKDSEGTILDVMRRINSLKDYERPAVMDSLFGSESIAGISALVNNVDDLGIKFDFAAKQANYAGSMTKEFQKKITETQGALSLFKNGLNAVNIELGKQLAPIVADLSTKMQPVIKNIREWMEKHPKLTQFIVLFVAAIGGLLVIIGPVIMAFGAMAFALGAMGLAAGPIALVVAGILLLVGLGVLLYQNWGNFETWFKQILIGLKDLIIGLFTFNPAKVWDAGKNIINGFIGGIKSGWEELKKTMNHTSSIVENTPKKDLDMHSPSRKMMAMGRFVNEGMALGIKNSLSLPHNAAKRISAAVLAGSAVTMPLGASANGVSSATYGVGTNSSFHGVNITININGAGANAEDIAAQVRQEVEKLMLQAKIKSRSNFGDS